MPDKTKNKKQKQISINYKLHGYFKEYCASKKVFMLEMVNQILLREMIKDGYSLPEEIYPEITNNTA